MQLNERILKIQRKLKSQKLDGVIISSVANITHLTGYSNFSVHEREALLVITGRRPFILTDGRYSEAVKRFVLDFELIQLSAKNQIKNVLSDLSKKLNIKKIGIEENNLTVREYKIFKKVFNNLVNFEVTESRAIKDKYEILQIEKACKIGDEAFDFLLANIKSGISEKELAFLLETFIKREGGDLSFEPIIGFSKNSSMPHHQTSKKVLNSRALQDDKEGQFVLFDFGVKMNNYCSDMTRTVFFGKANDKQKKIYKTVLEAQKLAMEFINKNTGKADVRAANVDEVARKHIVNKGFSSIPHSLGHGIGIEVHEHPYISPKSKEKLKSGMIFSIEPGIYIPGFGGVRIEDLFVLEDDGLRQLTSSSKNIIEL